jgi:PhnB protein
VRGTTATLLRGTHSFYPLLPVRAIREDGTLPECAGMSLEPRETRCYGRSVPELYPFLAVQDVAGAVDFYVRAFDAVEEDERLIAPDGRQVAVLQIAGQHLGIATEAPELGTPSPETVRATTVRISLHVDNPDAVHAQAVAAGATEMFPMADQPYGMRQGRVVDPFGHHWLIGKRI